MWCQTGPGLRPGSIGVSLDFTTGTKWAAKLCVVDAVRWRRIKEVLETVLETVPTARDAYLKKATGDDDLLRHEVESLLEHAEQEGFLDRSPVSPPPAGPTAGDPVEPTMPVSADKVDLVDLPPYSPVSVWTRRTRYELVVEPDTSWWWLRHSAGS